LFSLSLHSPLPPRSDGRRAVIQFGENYRVITAFTTHGVYDIMTAGLIQHIKGMINMADINDIVLIYLQDQPMAFARIEAIEPDIKRGWYHVSLLLLQIPPTLVTWILRDVYINGETFTMNGESMRLEPVVSPLAKKTPDTTPPETSGDTKGKVIALKDLKKK
jgi:hypothetical protein